MNRILKATLVVTIVLAAGWVHAAPAAALDRTERPAAVQAGGAFSLLQEATVLLDRAWSQFLEMTRVPVARDDGDVSAEPVILRPKTEGVTGQG